ncbi:MAG: hypothetical protein QM401_04130 [Bacillota bacterium]|nr:hypothetical protein [Bacillota bacterium]
MKRRITARTADDASARIWDMHPKALGVVIHYLYCGWWEFEVIERPSCTAMQRGPEVEHSSYFTTKGVQNAKYQNHASC